MSIGSPQRLSDGVRYDPGNMTDAQLAQAIDNGTFESLPGALSPAQLLADPNYTSQTAADYQGNVSADQIDFNGVPLSQLGLGEGKGETGQTLLGSGYANPGLTVNGRPISNAQQNAAYNQLADSQTHSTGKLLGEIALAAAAIYTGGAALGVWGGADAAAAGAAGAAGADAAGAAGVDIGGGFMSYGSTAAGLTGDIAGGAYGADAGLYAGLTQGPVDTAVVGSIGSPGVSVGADGSLVNSTTGIASNADGIVSADSPGLTTGSLNGTEFANDPTTAQLAAANDSSTVSDSIVNATDSNVANTLPEGLTQQQAAQAEAQLAQAGYSTSSISNLFQNPSLLKGALGAIGSLLGSHIAANAASNAGQANANAATSAANILAPAATTAAGIQANAATTAANTLATGATTAAGLQAGGITQGANTTANAITQGAGTVAGGITQGSETTAAGITQGSDTAAQGILQGSQTAAQGIDAQGNLIAAGDLAAAQQEVAGNQAAIGTAESTLAKQQGLAQPYLDAGSKALAELNSGLAPGGQFNRPFTMADAANSTAETFAQQQGQQAIENANAATGGQLSTNNLNQEVKFAEGTASTYEQQAFNQWLAQNNLTLGALQQMVQTGQVSEGQLQTAMAQAGVSIETLQQNIGSANAAGTLGAATALGNAAASSGKVIGAGQAGAADVIGTGQANSAGVLGKGQTGSANVTGNAQTAAGGVIGAGQTGAANANAGGVIGAAQANAAGQTGSAGYTASGIIGAANANAAGVVGSTAARTAGDVAASNLNNTGLSNAGNLLGTGLAGPALSGVPQALYNPSSGSYNVSNGLPSGGDSASLADVPTNMQYVPTPDTSNLASDDLLSGMGL